MLTTETVVNLISNTTTKSGLKIRSMIDQNIYEKGLKISDDEMKKVNITGEKFHPEWNYRITPNL